MFGQPSIEVFIMVNGPACDLDLRGPKISQNLGPFDLHLSIEKGNTSLSLSLFL